MNVKRILYAALLLLWVAGLIVFSIRYVNTIKDDYKIGERLSSTVSQNASDLKSGDDKTISRYRIIEWAELIPKDWNLPKPFKDLDINSLSDNDPRAQKAMDEFREAWDKAPVESGLQDEAIRIAGFMIPLDHEDGAMKEFLLVPYFGACIHVPPPPANQIIHVIMEKPVKGFTSMQAVWVNGTLDIERSNTAMGTAGYLLKGMEMEPYIFEKNR